MYLAQNPIGAVSGERGPFRFPTSSVRIPDIAVALWERFPNGKMPISQAIFEVVPNLAVEILSQGNTRREMELKRDEYLEVGVQLIWYVNPRARTATVYSSDGTVEEFDEHGTLSGANVLPGFELPLKPFFDHFPVEPA
jgi:Uma2 family endonuclease